MPETSSNNPLPPEAQEPAKSVHHEPTPIAPHEFLPKGFPNLHKEPPTDRSVRALRREGEKFPDTKAERIDAHFRRIDRALDRKPGLFMRLVKDELLGAHTLDILDASGKEDEAKVARLVQGLFESDKELLRRRGYGAELENYGDTPKPEDARKYREQLLEKRATQARGLTEWVDYLADPDAAGYPTWFKYYVLRSLTGMGKRIRGSEATDTQPAVQPGYTKRSKTTIQPFPSLDRGALGQALDEIQVSLARRLAAGDSQDELTELQRLADRGDFAKLYAHLQDATERIRRERELTEGTKGVWRTFVNDPESGIDQTDEMVASLKGKGTEWCIEGREVTHNYLHGAGEFRIFYTEDAHGIPSDPRIAIRLEQGRIAEVRGVLDKDQNLEPQFVEEARRQYADLPGSERFEQKDRDMKLLTAIEEKTKREQDLSPSDLIFLYELDRPIQGFGYSKDPRIAELRKTRNPDKDAPNVFGCTAEQIAHTPDAITADTKAYVGPLRLDQDPNFFQKITEYNIRHVYKEFPGKKIRYDIDVGGKNGAEYEAALAGKNIYVSEYAKFLLNSGDFKKNSLQKEDEVTLIRLTVSDLFAGTLPHGDYVTFAEIVGTAEDTDAAGNPAPYTKGRMTELGLELCSPDTGPALRLQDDDSNWKTIAMQPILDRDGGPRLFHLSAGGGELMLGTDDGEPGNGWRGGDQFVFRLRK